MFVCLFVCYSLKPDIFRLVVSCQELSGHSLPQTAFLFVRESRAIARRLIGRLVIWFGTRTFHCLGDDPEVKKRSKSVLSRTCFHISLMWTPLWSRLWSQTSDLGRKRHNQKTHDQRMACHAKTKRTADACRVEKITHQISALNARPRKVPQKITSVWSLRFVFIKQLKFDRRVEVLHFCLFFLLH